MPLIPPPLLWRALGDPEPEREYFVRLTFVPLRRPSKLPRFQGFCPSIA